MLLSTERRLIVPSAEAGVSRRQMLAGGAAAAAVATAAGFAQKVFAQAAPHRIDVHHHVSPPTWLDAVKSIKKDNPPMANWSVQKTLDDMDKGGVATAVTSPTTPQVIGLDKAVAARVARESNEFAKKLESDHKGRFGTFAMLPFPHVDECLAEIAYAFDTLKVDGIGCMTSYGDKWLGYAEFEPVWEELNRRKAIVYTHPTAANCCVNLVRGIDDAILVVVAGSEVGHALRFVGTDVDADDAIRVAVDGAAEGSAALVVAQRRTRHDCAGVDRVAAG